MAEPGGVLGRIAAAKREEVARRLDGVSIEALRSRAGPTRRSLADALAKPGSRFILEIKRGSPSEGAIRAGADAAGLARGYAGVADALSVLADRQFFGGSLDDISAARGAFDGPILAKDFFIDPRQVPEARTAGADAVLVMLSLLDDSAARAIIDEAERLGMDALVEVHDETEMRRAVALDAPLVGINNRDLRDLSVDLSTTERLARLSGDRILVAESGIHDRGEVERLAPHVDAFLVGTTLMRAERPAEAARALVFGRVKLCGLNRPEDVEAARPATYAGLVFVPGSPRQLAREQAAPIAGLARNSGILPVGVFRDAPVAEVAETAALLNLHAVQLHGSEDEAYGDALRAQVECELWGAVSVGCGALSRRGTDRLLFDNGSGGTGQPFDWTLIQDHPELSRAIVAGGVGAGNAARAAALGAHAIDVGSSVDILPGLKSRVKIDALFEALRTPCRTPVPACA